MGVSSKTKDYRNSRGEKVYPAADLSRNLYKTVGLTLMGLALLYFLRLLNFLILSLLRLTEGIDNTLTRIVTPNIATYPEKFEAFLGKLRLLEVCKAGWVLVTVLIILYLATIALRHYFQEINPFKNDSEARGIKAYALSALAFDYDPNEREESLWDLDDKKRQKKRKTQLEKDARSVVKRMIVHVHSRYDTRSKKVQKEYVIRIDQPRNVKIRGRVINEISGLPNVLQNAVQGTVGFGDMQVEADGKYFKFEGQKIIRNREPAKETEKKKLPLKSIKINLPKLDISKFKSRPVKKMRGDKSKEIKGYTYPLSLFKDQTKQIKIQTEKASEFAATSLKKIEQQLSTLEIGATLNEEPFISNTRIRYVFDVPLKTNYNFGDLETNLANALKVDSIQIEQSAGELEILVPLPYSKAKKIDYTIPIDVKTMIEKVFPDGNSTDPTEMILGLMVDGNIATEPLSQAPHLLIGGTTGGGKSALVNEIILTMMVHSTPDSLGIGLIDPKRVEFGMYEGNPFLIADPVLDAKDAVTFLQYLVIEMKRRYELFEQTKTKNLKGYNKLAEKKGWEQPKNLVVIVDEMAELMAEASNEVEMAIQRLGQAARAAGIHLILATQSPRVSVISGIIKANMPSRISMPVTSWNESNIILDESGAEKLSRVGEMLVRYKGYDKAIQCRGAYISDEEIQSIQEYLMKNVEPIEHVDYRSIVSEHAGEEDEVDKSDFFSPSQVKNTAKKEINKSIPNIQKSSAFKNKRKVMHEINGEEIPDLDRLNEEKIARVQKCLEDLRKQEQQDSSVILDIDSDEVQEQSVARTEESTGGRSISALQRMANRR